MNYRAVLVEDQLDQAAHTIRELDAAGFEVSHFLTVAAFDSAVASGDVNADVELFVLDRKLPGPGTSRESTDVGDQLLESVVASFPDSLVVVLSGYTDEDHVVQSMRGRGQIEADALSPAFDRVEVFKKRNLPQASAYFLKVATWLRSIDDISLEVRGATDLQRSDARLLRKLARGMDGVAIKARVLSGGLTSDVVCDCEILNARQLISGHVIAKITRNTRATVPQGLMASLPPGTVAVRTGSIGGVCAGKRLYVSQWAGTGTQSMMSDVALSGAGVEQLIEIMKAATSHQAGFASFEDLIAPLVRWPDAVANSAALGVDLPSATAWFPIRKGYQHGDLHAGNVLIAAGGPVVIDFDSEVEASVLLDPLHLILGTVFHPESPLRDSGPTGAELEGYLSGTGVPSFPFLTAAVKWLRDTDPDPKELWGLVLGFALRYASYPDVRSHPATLERIQTLAETASRILAA